MYMYTYMLMFHWYILVYKLETCAHTYKCTSYMHTCVVPASIAYIHTDLQISINTSMHPCMHAGMHAYTHIHTPSSEIPASDCHRLQRFWRRSLNGQRSFTLGGFSLVEGFRSFQAFKKIAYLSYGHKTRIPAKTVHKRRVPCKKD